MPNKKSKKMLFAEGLGFVVAVLIAMFVAFTILARFFISPVPGRAMIIGGLAAVVVTLFFIVPLTLSEVGQRAKYAEKECRKLDQHLSSAEDKLNKANAFIKGFASLDDVKLRMRVLQGEYENQVCKAQAILLNQSLAEHSPIVSLTFALQNIAAAKEAVMRAQDKVQQSHMLAGLHGFSLGPIDEYLKLPEVGEPKML